MSAYVSGNVDIARFYAEMIVVYMMEEVPGGFVPDLAEIQDALRLSEDEFGLGLDWCVSHEVIALRENGASSQDD